MRVDETTDVIMTVNDFCARWVGSRLDSPDAIQAIVKRWHVVARHPDSTSDFAKGLVLRGHLTLYQAKLLARGHVENFFFGPYKIVERTGKGRMAGVYKAVDRAGQPVAIKVLPPSKAKEPQLLARFQREAKLASQLNHSCIARMIDHGELRGLHYLVMEFVEGVTLAAVLRRRTRLSPQETAHIGLLTALGLQHLADKGLVHRDLEPGNLMLYPQPNPLENTLLSTVKLLDIGLGRVLFDPKSNLPSMALTGDGTVLGAPDYLAPEQARDASRADIRSDLYSLGCILYHALAGEPPFKDTNLVRQILRHATQPPRPLIEVNKETPAALDAIIQTLLAKDPAQRYEKPALLVDALRAWQT
jgi:serine/threonine protein kinase